MKDIQEFKDILLEEIRGFLLAVKAPKLVDEKIVLVVVDSVVTAKIVPVGKPKKSKSRLSKEESDRLAKARLVLKRGTDILYLYTLLVRTAIELKKFKPSGYEDRERSLVIGVEKDVQKLLGEHLLPVEVT